MHVFGSGYLDLMCGPRCVTRRGAEFSRFLPLAIDEGESQTVGEPACGRIWKIRASSQLAGAGIPEGLVRRSTQNVCTVPDRINGARH